MTDTDLSKFGIRDVEQKQVVVCRAADGGGPMYALLWRTSGKRGRPLPTVGEILDLKTAGLRLRVTEIRPPGTLDLDATGRTLVVTPGDTP
jgi:hypothetical protein